MLPKSRFDRLMSGGWGGVMEVRFAMSVAGPAFLMAHKLSGNASGLQGSAELSPRSQRSPCPNTRRQYVSGLVFEPSRGYGVAPSVKTCTSDPPVVQGETVIPQSDICTRGPHRVGHHITVVAEAMPVRLPPRSLCSREFWRGSGKRV